MADNNFDRVNGQSKEYRRVTFQGWLSLALWMSFGLLLESLMAYKSPAYLDDPQRRELFRLAHAHGSLLGVVMVIAAMWARSAGARLSRLVVLAVRFGAAVMPIGFLVAGLWHPESDPGVAIWLVPAGALPLIFGLISIALSSRVTK
jgi:hypothetical protein